MMGPGNYWQLFAENAKRQVLFANGNLLNVLLFFQFVFNTYSGARQLYLVGFQILNLLFSQKIL